MGYKNISLIFIWQVTWVPLMSASLNKGELVESKKLSFFAESQERLAIRYKTES